ncbi:MAG: 3-phosphoshikimate 1-carboxyvinyltransferase [Pseudoclavibacter sp.]|nr:3-phosphoshikimate 1-carboxyvinyltransferase [Pseudoclavibacter sp.]
METFDYSPPAHPAGPLPWRAPRARGRLDARIRLPGSKSLSNRQLVLSALAEEPSLLRAPLHARDSELMRSGLERLGVRIETVPGDGPHGDDLRVAPPAELRGGGEIDCGLAGTVMRFLPPLAALAVGEVRFDGDEAARLRPMEAMIRALRELGAPVRELGRPGRLPFVLRGTARVRGGELRIDASASSQFVSGLLLAAPRFERGLRLEHAGERPPSGPHIEMTLACLRERGVEAAALDERSWRVEPGAIRGGTVDIEPDLSNAAPFLAAAVVAGGAVTIPEWPERSTQLGGRLTEILAGFGARLRPGPDGLDCIVQRGVLQGAVPEGVELELSDAGELTPAVAALAALCRGTSVLSGIGHLRGHETDRLRALATELRGVGARVEELEDGLRITSAGPGSLHGAAWSAYGDHRMATCGAIVGLAVDGVEIDDIGATAKTMPQFPGLWRELLSQRAALPGAGA